MDTLADTLWREFAVETEEHLLAVEPILAQADPQRTSGADIAQLFRSFHSIKGLAGAMEVAGMASVAHHAENLLGLVRDDRAPLTLELADLLLQAVDALKRMRDVLAEGRCDTPADPNLVARLVAAFARSGGAVDGGTPEPAPPSAAGSDSPLHEDPEMLAIFVEMVKANGPELCAALADDARARDTAVDAAETLSHAAEVMNFDMLSASLGGLRDVLQPLASADGLDEPTREKLLTRLGELRLQIELVAEITGQDAGAAAFSAALAQRIGNEPHRLAPSLGALDRRLRDDLADGDRRAAEAEASATARPGAATSLIRVRGEIVDAFLDDIGELRATAGTLSHLIRGIGPRAVAARAQAVVERLPGAQRDELIAMFQELRERDRRLQETEELISGLLSRLHQGALGLRVVPVDVVFNRLPRLVRDLAQRQGKSLELALAGRDVRIDKSMVEALADPLIHMVRNAVDHGIELPEERRAAGKPERAQLTVRAAQRGSEIHIEVADDGRGLDPEAIRAKAVARGLVSAAEAAMLPDREAYQFIFEAGLSTAPTVTETSGRGVGMDIVLATVRRLNGDIAIRSERGKGTAFTLGLPVSAALQTALIVQVGEERLAIPERHVMAVAEIETGAIRLVGAHRSIVHRQAVLPLYRLGALLGLQNGATAPEREWEPVVVATNGRSMIGLEVDAIERLQELFLKDLDPRLARFPGVGGASVLGDGRVVLVLDGEELIQLAARGIDRPAAGASRMAS